MMEPSLRGRGVNFSPETLTFIPASARIRPLRDNLIVEPLDQAYSNIIAIIHKTKPLKGVVKAVGPGHYPKLYDHRDKHKRTKMWDSKVFRPTEVKVGDVIELGGAEIQGYAFEAFWWGDTLHLYGATERDVAAIHTEVSGAGGRADTRALGEGAAA